MAKEEENNKKDPESNEEETTQEKDSEKEEQQDVEENKKEDTGSESEEKESDKEESEDKESSEEESSEDSSKEEDSKEESSEGSEEKEEKSSEEESDKDESEDKESSEEKKEEESTEEESDKEETSEDKESSKEESESKDDSKDSGKSEDKSKVEVVDSKSNKGSKVPIFVTILIIAIVGGGMFYFFGMDNDQGGDEDIDLSVGNETQQNEQQMQGKVTVIKDSDCKECFNVSTLTQQLPFQDKTVQEVSESESLIDEYNISKAPVIIVTGSNQDLTRAGFQQKGDAWVYEDSTPYVDLETDEVKGLVNLTLIHYPECDECLNNSALIQSLTQTFGVGSKEIIERSEAEELIGDFNITTFPTVLIDGQYDEYSFYEQVKEQGREQDGTLILNKFNPPFYDAESESVKGKVNMTFIEASNCDNCTETTQLDMLLARGIRGIQNKETLTQSEASDMIEELNIETLPTVVITEEIEYYGNMFDQLKGVGSFEDGRYVLRECEQLRLNCVNISDV